MAIFDYLVIAFALLFTAAAMRLIGGMPSALAAPKRYWVHAVFTVTTLIGVAVAFWNFWVLRDLTWTLPKFLFALAMPGLNYYLATVLIPENPADVESWREYYYAVRVRFFGGFAALLAVQAVSAYFFLGMAWTSPVRLVDAGFIAFALTGMLSSSPRVHGTLAVILAVLLLAMAGTIAAQPGWLGG